MAGETASVPRDRVAAEPAAPLTAPVQKVAQAAP